MKKVSALLLVDLITDFNFEDGDQLFEQTLQILPNLTSWRKTCFELGMPIIFVNDPAKNRSSSYDDRISETGKSERGRFMLDQIGPRESDSIILKPQRSGFYETDLESTLKRIRVNHVYVTGVTTDICVLFTAHDAYMRKFKVSVPEDCVTAVKDEYHSAALSFLGRVAEAETQPMVSAE